MFAVNIDPQGEALKIIKDLANDRELWGNMVVSAYQTSVDVMFKTGGFGKWSPLKPATVRYRGRRSRGYYKKKAPEAGTGAAFPPNTWTGRLRNTIAGRALRGAIIPQRLRGGRENFKISTRLAHARAALDLRPIEGIILDQLVTLMADKITKGLTSNIEERLNKR